MNVATFAGHVGKDANLEYTKSGKAVASFTFAVNNGKDESGKDRQPSWIKAVLWEKKAEALAKHITKGRMVAVSGPVSVEAWIDKQGAANAVVVVTVREFTFCGGGEKEESKAA